MSPKVKEEDGSGAVKSASKRKMPEKQSDEYKEKRQRNNIAVKKSREKSRAKARETQERVTRLKKENEDLEMKVQLLSKELSVLKDLFLAHASSVAREPESCPDPGVKMEPKAEKSEDKEVELDSSQIGSPVNQEGLQNDHEYFSSRSRVMAK